MLVTAYPADEQYPQLSSCRLKNTNLRCEVFDRCAHQMGPPRQYSSAAEPNYRSIATSHRTYEKAYDPGGADGSVATDDHRCPHQPVALGDVLDRQPGARGPTVQKVVTHEPSPRSCSHYVVRHTHRSTGAGLTWTVLHEFQLPDAATQDAGYGRA
jgi:hypothetical protein